MSSEDSALLISSGLVEFMAKVSSEEGKVFEAARAGYMSATCRIKAGESDRVG